MTVTAMNHFTILTDDLPATLAFYEQHLDLKPGARPPFTFPGAWLYAEGGKGKEPILHIVAGKPKDVLVKGVIDHMAFSGKGLAAAVHAVGEAISGKGGMEAANLKVAQEYVAAFAHLARTTNTLILPASAGDVAGIVATAMTVLEKTKHAQAVAKGV